MAYYGTYTLELTGSLNPNLLSTFSFELIVLPYPNTGPPRFTGGLKTPYTVTVGSDSTFPLPGTKDPDGDSFAIQVTYSTGPTFPSYITYDDLKKSFVIKPAESDVGQYVFTINMTDSHPLKCLSNVVVFEIDVQLFSFAQL